MQDVLIPIVGEPTMRRMAVREVNIGLLLKCPDRLAELEALMEANRVEVEGHLAQEVRPDWGAYVALQEQGALIALGAFDAEDALVGYACALLAPSLHYGYVMAMNDVIFVLPECRKQGYGVRLMRAVEREAKARGARVMAWQAKLGSGLGDVLLRRGFRAEEVTYTKGLCDGS